MPALLRHTVRRRGAVLGLTGLVAAGLLFVPSPAGAATYTVESCTNGSISGWSSFYHGAWSQLSNSCGLAGGGLKAGVSTEPGATAGWKFNAPADTEIAGFRLTRAFSLPANQAFGTGVVTTMTEGTGNAFFDWEPNFGGLLSVGPQLQSAANLNGQTSLTAKVDCGGGGLCTGGSEVTVYGASIDLRDGFAPALGTVSGSLLGQAPLKGTRALSFSASDRGGGIRREQLLVDGQPSGDRWLDCNFAHAVPCPLTDSGTFALDTTELCDGDHEVELRVTDATMGNGTRYGPLSVTVDNVPPPAVTVVPRIFGSAVQGQLLYADDGSWVGDDLSFKFRWQRYEDGSWQDIPGAEASAYVPTADDAGHRLRVRVLAANAEGATDAYSDATGAVPVPESPTPAPSPTPTPTPTPSPSPAAVVVAVPNPAPVAAPAAALDAPARVAAAFQATGRTTITLPFGQRPKITGTLTRADGRPLAGAALAVTSRLRMLEAQPLRVGHVVTDSAGRFTYTPTGGASRTLAFRYGDAAASVTLRVVPKVTLRVRANGRLEGRVSGAPAGLRPTIDLQGPHGRVWRTFATTRLRPTGGTFAYYGSRPPRRVRALVRADPSWPFATGTSAPATRER